MRALLSAKGREDNFLLEKADIYSNVLEKDEKDDNDIKVLYLMCKYNCHN
jgi:hypothetical protein